ncbi:hypothetical protein A0J48_003150 [Sphaerospermopsis aphanizomenoides BCCUSP55]|uniref:hypothetical protein n=1 Tax=Sphaerospermopsis aphanizomenoides TaxID=459663 RepID=UPI0019072460|nr:hypothetical protein [Sphaerospermopsis aphanizomenoides]MBK1986551.1 hypothetical protein [Sphaerospermopsis aphanizomenoides BCCUSP55]
MLKNKQQVQTSVYIRTPISPCKNEKITSLLFTATFLASFLSNLGMGINSKQLISSAIAQTNNSQSSQMQPLEFTDENIKFTLLAPQGAKVIKESWGTIKIQAGNNFTIELIYDLRKISLKPSFLCVLCVLCG